MTDLKTYIGERVEIPVHYDAWMRGARFGVVTGARKGGAGKSDYVTVRSEHPGIKKLIKVWRLDIPYMKMLGARRNPRKAKRNPRPTKKKASLEHRLNSAAKFAVGSKRGRLKSAAMHLADRRTTKVYNMLADYYQRVPTQAELKKALRNSVVGSRQKRNPRSKAAWTEITAYKRGEKDAQWAMSAGANPFKHGTKNYIAWLVGWEEARGEGVKRNPRSKFPAHNWWRIRGYAKDGKAYYFTGTGFDPSSRKAVDYPSEAEAAKALRAIEYKLPAQIILAGVGRSK